MKNSAFFPLFVDISEKKIVVIGGGAIATRRVKTLLPFEPQIVVVAPEVTGDLEELEKEEKITIFHREYQREDIYDAWMVLAATNDPELNNGIYSVAKCLGALVNVASNQEKCDFHFPGVIRKDPYVIGINGSGKDHKGTAELRKQIEAMVNNSICIGSRESRLAVIQSEMVMEYLKKECPQKEIRLLTMKTTGDKILDRTLDKVGGKGLFVKELDKALLERRSDLSVHSLKDMPAEIPTELPLIGFSKREDPRDVLVLPDGVKELDFSKPVGCSSQRRMLQFQKLYPQAVFKPIRGNVQTRLAKLDSGEFSATILAAAGLKRLGLENRITRYFSVEEMIPAAGQGVLALQGRIGENYAFLQPFCSEASRITSLCERAFIRELDGGCSSPVAAHATIAEDGKLTLRGLYYVEATGKSVIETEFIYLAKENLLQKDLSDSIDPTDCTDHKKVVFKPNACNLAENFGRNLARRLQAEGKAQEER